VTRRPQREATKRHRFLRGSAHFSRMDLEEEKIPSRSRPKATEEEEGSSSESETDSILHVKPTGEIHYATNKNFSGNLTPVRYNQSIRNKDSPAEGSPPPK